MGWDDGEDGGVLELAQPGSRASKPKQRNQTEWKKVK
jgi:hypothetical protein